MNIPSPIHVLARAVLIKEDHILLCKTQDLECNFFFLPGGHVEHGESAENGVLRELKEEGGIEGTIKRFIGCFEYSFEPGQNSKCHNHEYNLYFEVDVESLPFQAEIPQMEKHVKLMWLPLSRLTEIDFRPQPLKTILLEWMSYGLNPAFKSEERNAFV